MVRVRTSHSIEHVPCDFRYQDSANLVRCFLDSKLYFPTAFGVLGKLPHSPGKICGTFRSRPTTAATTGESTFHAPGTKETGKGFLRL
mmetsp:Transcript_42312/g.78804  ORF Transcript_42312/g.78804 Transcript_42312/m.78804 type:complete len:88 (-) Transcript_42312:247-510(-)